ncbi:caspase family protein [Roseospira visakhapatnamensis]|uniref:Putative caspase-like protein n=1 Tax=Roseospira visakhapatnamensis TaxID=390880 RepID=A0A7W6RFM8_9PROT|nr:caspase family protein [Roseospira visakhapatnamensis]MBB4267450.1 putative caspase-like protein [Roseospira visakhapatnamensis]
MSPGWRGAWTGAAALAAVSLGGLPAVSWAATDDGALRALVVGINAYSAITPLEGAVNDARAIAESLRTVGVSDVTVLLDQAVSRDSLMGAWDDLITRSQPGDVLLFTYAGHGGQEPERVPGSEEDRKDENFLLTGYSDAAPDNHERIIDDEISALLRRAQGRTVVFIADSCHSGTVTRAFDPRAATHRTRFTNVGPIEDDMLPPPPSPTDASNAERPGETGDAGSLAHVLFVAGVDEDKQVPEVTIKGRQHGALSYSVARALIGEGDRDGDGRVTVAEFQHYLRQGVRVYTDGRQSIRLDVGADVPVTRSLASVAGGAVPGMGGDPVDGGGFALAPVPAALPTTPEPVALHILDDGGVSDAHQVIDEAPVRLVPDPSDADLVWDLGAGALVSSLGDVVATLPAGPEDERRAAAARVLTKWALIETLKTWPESKRLIMDLSPDNGLHHVGDPVTLSVSGHTLPYLVLFNLDPFGGLNRVFPVPDLGDRLDAHADGRALDLSMEVYRPVGGDHFVALAIDQPPLALYDALASLDGRPVDTVGLLTVLRQAVDGRRHEMGLHGVFTAEE